MSAPHLPFLYVDAFSGASGDMFLGALVDLGAPVARLREAVAGLGVPGLTLRRSRVVRGGLTAVRVQVRAPGEQPHRGRREIRRLLRAATLSPPVRRRAIEVFDRLIDAEAAIHGIPPDKVHVHEVGALDALADVVGTLAGLHALGVTTVHAAPVNVGSGTVRCDHGVLPVPAPATAALLRDVPVYGAGEGERTTPTGAALLAVLADRFGPLPPARVRRIGHGAGTRDDPERPNVLRLLGGDLVAAAGDDAPAPEVVELRCQIDDLDPRVYGHLVDRLLEAGALDVFTTPVQMKKQRPGTLVTVVAAPEQASDVGDVLLSETSTLGYRYERLRRVERPRRQTSVRTRYGRVRVKVTTDDGLPPVATPEYDDCRRLARERGVPLRTVLEAARTALDAVSAPGRRGRKT